MTATPIDPAAFAGAMRAKWMEYDNVESPTLHAVWSQICETLNQQTLHPVTPRPVIPAELGAGKTTAAKVWCAMLPNDATHPGVLVVVRTIEQAEEITHDINAWAQASVALAFHTNVTPKLTEAQTRTAPVLVICHMRYSLALDHLLVEECERYDRLLRFRGGVRRLAIVDEALDQVYVARIEPKDFTKILALHPRILSHHPRAVHVVQAAQRAILLNAPERGDRVVSTETLLADTATTAADADAALVAFWTEIRASKYATPKERQAMLEILTALRRQLVAYRWTESEKRERALIGARLLLPPDAGQVHLDATGRLNNVYIGRPDDYAVQAMPGVRSYRNVTLYVAHTSQGTGIWAMRRDGERIATEARDAVLTHYGAQAKERRVFVVTNEESEPLVRRIWKSAGFTTLAVAHWGAIDGRNVETWRESDTLVTITLPWARRSVDTSTFMALTGAEMTDDELSAPPEAVRRIQENRMAAEIAQAAGRIRLRRMVSADGQCEPCDLFVRFPHRRELNGNSDHILAGINQTLPGLRVLGWSALSDERTPDGRPPTRRNAVHDALLERAKALSPGERHDLTRGAFSRMSWHRAGTDAQTAGHALHQALAALGVRLEPGGRPAGVRGQGPVALVRADVSGQYPSPPVGVTRSRAERKRAQRMTERAQDA